MVTVATLRMPGLASTLSMATTRAFWLAGASGNVFRRNAAFSSAVDPGW